MSSNNPVDLNNIEMVQLVEIDQSGQASLGEIIELYSSDDEGGADTANTNNADIIQIDCSDQAFADLLRLNVATTTTPNMTIPTAPVISVAGSTTKVPISMPGQINVVQEGPSTSGQGQGTSQQGAVVNSQDLLQMLAACTNGLVTAAPTTSATKFLIKEEKEKPKAMVKPMKLGPKPPRKRVCLNLDCKKSSPTMKKAGFVELYYFGLPKNSKHKCICDSCDKLVQGYREGLAKALEEKRSVFSIPTPFRTGRDAFVIDDDDEDDSDSAEPEPEEDKTVYIVPANIGEIIDGVISKIDISGQKQLCIDYLQKQLDEQVNWIMEAEAQCLQLEQELAEKNKLLNANRHQNYVKALLRGLDIDANGHVKAVSNDASTSTEKSVERPKLKAQSTKPGPPAAGVSYTKSKPQPLQTGLKFKEDPDVVTIGTAVVRPKLELNPTPDPIPRRMLSVGDRVYGMKYTAKNYWLPGTIIDTRKNIFNMLEFKVQFETTKKGRPVTDSTLDPKDKAISVKSLNPKHIAYNKTCPFVLRVGTRVIARFKAEVPNRWEGIGFYFAGVIAEQPRNINDYRYLIFFDDGYAQYVGQHDVLLVCEASKEVWQDVHPDSQQFIKSYLSTYPEKAMLRLNKGSHVSMEWNGKWYQTRVVDVDASLVRVQFERIARTEWVYRGSSRLYPIFVKYRRQVIPSISLVIRRNEGKIPIEYPDDDLLMGLNKTEHMAKKRTSHPPPSIASTAIPPSQVVKAPLPIVKPPVVDTTSLPEFEGKLMKFKMLARPGPKPFVEHECWRDCVEKFDPSLPELERFSPLLQPMYYNWAREIGKFPKRHVYYRAPCGVRLRHYGELEKFLEQTKCNMGIEYFCFDLAVHPYAEFVPLRQMYNIKDLSYGKENVSIQCINSIDHDYPDFVSYTPTRIPGKDVTINLDDDFLACCDCTDNCLDKEKCSCWQRTLEGAKFMNPNVDPYEVGYQQRRLHEHIISGIYECNKKCKCLSTCSNRVAQNPLKWKLQVFKTSTKGWGVRALNDIPTGSFIVPYAGQMLNEVSANEDGQAQGDEYLAELDYIEVIETFKEGYEAEAYDPEAESAKIKDDPDFKLDSDEDMADSGPGVPRKSTCSGGDYSDEEALSTRRPSRFNPKIDDTPSAAKKYKPTRKYFGEDESCYIMDAKTIGNIGRYLNHSCEPNVFVQNVFVDTHDLRFPWVCFFAYKYIRAGTELTWDYNYDIGSVPGKSMYCYCAASECRGRLL